MPRSLSALAIVEKNKLATDSIWHLLLEITIPGVGAPVRIAYNNENVTWRSQTWQAFPFELGEIGEESKGEIPQVELKVSNVSRIMESYVQEYDYYTKVNGFSPIICSIFVVNSKNFGSSTPEVEHLFELQSVKTNSMWVSFILGASNPFNLRYPTRRLLKNHCGHSFKDAWCKYAGAETTCDKTLTRCRVLLNSANYGGFPGVGYGGLRLA
jgi:lambda family phage minor tail protein L